MNASNVFLKILYKFGVFFAKNKNVFIMKRF